jgi:hypothetical protein
MIGSIVALGIFTVRGSTGFVSISTGISCKTGDSSGGNGG